MSMESQRFVGLMSGTSLDAIDVVLVEFDTSTLNLLATYLHPWPPVLRETLLTLSQHTCENSTLREIAPLDIQVGKVLWIRKLW